MIFLGTLRRSIAERGPLHVMRLKIWLEDRSEEVAGPPLSDLEVFLLISAEDALFGGQDGRLRGGRTRVR